MNHIALDDLHPDLVSDEARELIEIGRSNGAVGWKTNGAGGPGGSMALVGPADRRACGDSLRDCHRRANSLALRRRADRDAGGHRAVLPTGRHPQKADRS